MLSSRLFQAETRRSPDSEQVKDFLDVISNAFAGLAAVTEDDPEAERKADEPTMAQQLRRTSLLGSVGMLRVLGGVFRQLRADENPAELDDITEFFKRLDPHMTAPVTDTSIWRTTDARRLRAERVRADHADAEHRPSGGRHHRLVQESPRRPVTDRMIAKGALPPWERRPFSSAGSSGELVNYGRYWSSPRANAINALRFIPCRPRGELFLRGACQG